MSAHHDLATCLNCGRVFDQTDIDGCECHGEDAHHFTGVALDEIDVTAGPKGLLFRCRKCFRWTDLDGFEPCDCQTEPTTTGAPS